MTHFEPSKNNINYLGLKIIKIHDVYFEVFCSNGNERDCWKF